MKSFLYAYVLAFATVTTLAIYGLQLPQRITGANALVREYYVDNAGFNLLFELVVAFVYITIAQWIMKKVGAHDFSSRLLTVILSTIGISGAFLLFFLSHPASSSFFSRWFRTARHWTLLYDAILVGSIFSLSVWLERRLR